MREIKFRVWDKKYKKMYESRDIRTALVFPSEDVEIMQYTGLLDASGVEIYEGDMIEGKLKNPTIGTMGVIAYDAYWSAFGNLNNAGFTMLFKITNIEVIGNVYEHPELLK